MIEESIKEMVNARLRRIEKTEKIHILYAVESGSRAWGFASADSDYDIRFVYAKRPKDYITFRDSRDVIEVPIEANMDYSGWDIYKALNLLVFKSNAVILEWLTSPIVYRSDDDFSEGMLKLAAKVLRKRNLLWHYMCFTERQIKEYLHEDDTIRLKKVFYIVRGAMALRVLRLKKDSPIIPMNLHELMRQSRLPRNLTKELMVLLSEKMISNEDKKIQLSLTLKQFLTEEIGLAKATLAEMNKDGRALAQPPEIVDEAEVFFRQCLGL